VLAHPTNWRKNGPTQVLGWGITTFTDGLGIKICTISIWAHTNSCTCYQNLAHIVLSDTHDKFARGFCRLLRQHILHGLAHSEPTSQDLSESRAAEKDPWKPDIMATSPADVPQGLQSTTNLTGSFAVSLPTAFQSSEDVYKVSIEDWKWIFGQNIVPQCASKNLLQLIWLVLKDKVLVCWILSTYSVSLLLSLFQDFGQPCPDGKPPGQGHYHPCCHCDCHSCWVMWQHLSLVTMCGATNLIQWASQTQSRSFRTASVLHSGKDDLPSLIPIVLLMMVRALAGHEWTWILPAWIYLAIWTALSKSSVEVRLSKGLVHIWWLLLDQKVSTGVSWWVRPLSVLLFMFTDEPM